MRIGYFDFDELIGLAHQSNETVVQQRVAQGFTQGLLGDAIENVGYVLRGYVAHQGSAALGSVEFDLHNVAEVDRRNNADDQGFERHRAQRQLCLKVHAPLLDRQQQLTRGAAAFQIAVRRGGIGQRIGVINAQF